MNKAYFLKHNNHLHNNARLLTKFLLKFSYIAKRTGILTITTEDLKIGIRADFDPITIGPITITPYNNKCGLLQVIGFDRKPYGPIEFEKFSDYLEFKINEQNSFHKRKLASVTKLKTFN